MGDVADKIIAAAPARPLFYFWQPTNFMAETRLPARSTVVVSHSRTMPKVILYAILSLACLLPFTVIAQDAKPPSPVRAVFEGNLE